MFVRTEDRSEYTKEQRTGGRAQSKLEEKKRKRKMPKVGQSFPWNEVSEGK